MTITDSTANRERRNRLTFIIDELAEVGHLQDGDGGVDGIDLDLRFLVIERNWRYGRGYWLTSAADLAEAGYGHLGQEYAEEWELIGAVDLDTGQRWDGAPVMVWTPSTVASPVLPRRECVCGHFEQEHAAHDGRCTLRGCQGCRSFTQTVVMNETPLEPAP